MHLRQDLTHHVLVPEQLARGYAVWTQGTRSVNNDISLLHEQALLDAATGQVFLRDASFDHRVTLGHSGGGTLYTFYHQQAGSGPKSRLSCTPSGRPVDLAAADMPLPDGAIFMAPHPGQGALLLRLIDPSVVGESDPMSVDPTHFGGPIADGAPIGATLAATEIGAWLSERFRRDRGYAPIPARSGAQPRSRGRLRS